MPLISQFYGILIRMFFNDQEQHYLPHFHAVYGEYSGSFTLDGELITGDIPKKQQKLVAALGYHSSGGTRSTLEDYSRDW
ncbi:MAG: DUF4160 domain-containing protein [Bacillota bacterium]